MVGIGARIAAIVLALLGMVWGLFLTFKILQHIGASELMWFVFWLYVPIVLIGMTLAKLVTMSDE